MYLTTTTILFLHYLFSGILYESRSPVWEILRWRFDHWDKKTREKQYGIDVRATSSRRGAGFRGSEDAK